MKKLISIPFTVILFLLACTSNDDKIELINKKAALPQSFHFDEKGLKVMATLINKKTGTMSVLYANPVALNKAFKGGTSPVTGEVLALVTWKQQDDDHWFGGRIPRALQTVELVKTTTAKAAISISYEKYSGSNSMPASDTVGRNARISYMFSRQASVMP